ncbi:MAG: class I SAM-dependent methyltransferase [Corynebacteriales bacterium]|nr:class I SAM-dependent methyltransferase [Mycobacteriales bacterium]
MNFSKLTTLLAQIAAENTTDPLSLATKLRANGHTPELVAQAMTQHRLRQRAIPKFGSEANRMFFTENGVEQATRKVVADRRATRFSSAGVRSVIDLGCGVGADLIAFARASLTAVGVERDADTAEIAAANLAALEIPHAQIRQSDATDIDMNEFDSVFCDPARRGGGRRLFDPDDFSPPWSFVTQLLKRQYAAVKLGPGLDHALIPDNVEAEWVSCEGTVVELALWSPGFSQAARRAVVFGREKRAAELVGTGLEKAPTGAVGNYLYDPDGAIVRSHLIAELSKELNAHLVDEHIAYLTNDTAINTPFARRMTVEEVMPFSVKKLRAWLRAREIGTLEIKKRGIAVTPEQLRPQLKLHGPNTATVVLTRLGTQPTAFICS